MSKAVNVQNQTDVIIEICRELSEEEQLRVTVVKSLKGTAVTGALTLLGGLLGGAPGMLIGGAAGSVASYMMGGQFEPISEIIRRKMTPEQKTRLANRVRKLMGSSNMKDVAGGMLQIASKGNLKQNIKKEMVNFFQNEFGKLVYSK